MKTFTCFVVLVMIGTATPALAEDYTQKQIIDSLLESFGLEQWDKIEAIQFTFNVRKEDKRIFRTWTWHPKTGKVIYSGPLGEKDLVEVTYNRNKLDDKNTKRIREVDAMFINDSFWLLLPLHLSWTKDITVKYNSFQATPIGKNLAKEVVVTYPKTGGYTPGDVYKLYVDDQWRIMQWSYHKGGANKAAVKAVWMKDKQVGPLVLTTDFEWTEQKFWLWFTTLKVLTVDDPEWIEARPVNHKCRICG